MNFLLLHTLRSCCTRSGIAAHAPSLTKIIKSIYFLQLHTLRGGCTRSGVTAHAPELLHTLFSCNTFIKAPPPLCAVFNCSCMKVQKKGTYFSGFFYGNLRQIPLNPVGIFKNPSGSLVGDGASAPALGPASVPRDFQNLLWTLGAILGEDTREKPVKLK